MRSSWMAPMVLCLSLWLLSRQADGQIFSSMGELAKVFKMEVELVSVLQRHRDTLEESLNQIKNYAQEVKAMYEKEDCWPVKEKCTDQNLMDKIVGNPIYNYQVLKRLNVYFKKVEEATKAVDTKKTLQELRKVRNKHGGLPTEADLQGAAKALNRLQDMYKLNITDFARGRIFGLQTAAELSVKDTFFLGRFAMMNDNPEVALRWLEEAVIQAASEGNHTSPVKADRIEQVIKQVERKLPPGFRDIASFEGTDDFENNDFNLLKIPEKTRDPAKFTTLDDEMNYKALCQGRTLLSRVEQAKLLCSYSTLAHPFYLIGPVKTEVAYNDPHKIVILHEVIHDNEIEAIIQAAKPKINTATTGQERSISDLRVSRNGWLPDTEPSLTALNYRMNLLTGLQTVQALDAHQEGKKEEYEMFQVANYGIGGHYGFHQDPMFVYKEPDYLAKLGQDDYVTGDRMATLMLYLSDVSLGGRTAFPRLGISIVPKKGSAVFWYKFQA
ncbi:prolyl 4-hydroxylase subunit alpha-2-like [Tigriopus californicus]|uniref:prolyl 4-hydroxylase subunit alpha-2-like n=1 Tax=Tigriopus californicus TaxID=6832 RepID=UPI0027DA945F|nr:prolyl 4-hydroxylase subunit alpha-2-like [Tigriopus californicus]